VEEIKKDSISKVEKKREKKKSRKEEREDGCAVTSMKAHS
jgi:hypothetical protein